MRGSQKTHCPRSDKLADFFRQCLSKLTQSWASPSIFQAQKSFLFLLFSTLVMNIPLKDRFPLTKLARMTYTRRITFSYFNNNKHDSQGSWHTSFSHYPFSSCNHTGWMLTLFTRRTDSSSAGGHVRGKCGGSTVSIVGLESNDKIISICCCLWLQMVRERKKSRKWSHHPQKLLLEIRLSRGIEMSRLAERCQRIIDVCFVW